MNRQTDLLRVKQKDGMINGLDFSESYQQGIPGGEVTVQALIIGGAGASIPEIIILASMFKRKHPL